MQVLVLYYSKGGNTRKLAERIAEGIKSVSGVQALLKSTQEVTKEDFVDAAGVIAGSPVKRTTPREFQTSSEGLFTFPTLELRIKVTPERAATENTET